MPPQLLPAVWSTAAPLIRRAMEKVGFGPFAEVERDVFNVHALLWLAHDDKEINAAAVTQVYDGVCTIVACGGRGEWKSLIDGIENYAKAAGCSRMRIIGRKGWRRVLPTYKQTCVVLEKEI